MNQFESRIVKRINAIKLEINTNFEYCQNEINKSQIDSFAQIETFERDLLANLNKSKENNKIPIYMRIQTHAYFHLNQLIS